MSKNPYDDEQETQVFGQVDKPNPQPPRYRHTAEEPRTQMYGAADFQQQQYSPPQQGYQAQNPQSYGYSQGYDQAYNQGYNQPYNPGYNQGYGQPAGHFPPPQKKSPVGKIIIALLAVIVLALLLIFGMNAWSTFSSRDTKSTTQPRSTSQTPTPKQPGTTDPDTRKPNPSEQPAPREESPLDRIPRRNPDAPALPDTPDFRTPNGENPLEDLNGLLDELDRQLRENLQDKDASAGGLRGATQGV